MPTIAQELRNRRAARREARQITTVDDYAWAVQQAVMDAGLNGSLSPYSTTWGNEPAERVGESLAAYAKQLHGGNGLVFSVMTVRMLAFSLVRLQWQSMRSGRPDRLFGTPSLGAVESPYPGGTTQDLMGRAIQDADLSGQSYHVRDGNGILRLRPDWVQIILMPIELGGGLAGWRRIGYTYHDGGVAACPPEEVAIFTANEVAHWAPYPDPMATFRGMSWLTPVIREVENDKAMERHKTKFFENAATPNISVSLDARVTPKAFAEFKEKMDLEHVGVDNAYKTLYLGGGADVKVIGANLQQLDFQSIQGRGETRVAAAGGVPPIIVGLSEGLSASTYSNYGQAIRRFADLTMAYLWGGFAASMATILPAPGRDARLWWDARDVAFLRSDRKDAAEIEQIKAATIGGLVNNGFTPESAIAAVEGEDMSLLVHTGLTSVQLQPPVTEGGDTQGGSAPASSGNSTPSTPSTNGANATNDAVPAWARNGYILPGTLPGPQDEVDHQLLVAGRHPALNGAHHG